MKLTASGFAVLISMGVALGEAHPPELVRVFPLGGQAGTTVSLEILGKRFSNITGVEFDSQDLVWDQKTSQAGPVKVTGDVRISGTAALGAHTLRVMTLDGPSNSAIFNVGQFPSPREIEPNNKLDQAQRLPSLPVEVQGKLDGAPDIDIYSFQVNKGERWVFDLRSIEDGSSVEARMILMDVSGKQISFNDDRDDYNENPLIEYTFSAAGVYYVKLDQYRGPRGFNFGKSCSYVLRISALPSIKSTYPMAVRTGSEAVMRLRGSGLDSIQKVYLTELRQAEYARMTYPYTMPIHFRQDPSSSSHQVRIEGRVKHRTSESAEVVFPVPATAKPGLWKLWASGAKGFASGLNINVVDEPLLDETAAVKSTLASAPLSINGELAKPGEKDVFRIEGRAGQPLHFLTIAAQLGVPYLDSVLTLRDASGNKLAENDDVVAGQGTLLGNPDSSLFFTPKQDGPLVLELRDRVRRGGPGFEYCLKIRNERPGFQLFTTPENFTITPGGTSEIKVHLIRETGFEGEIEIWFEGLPPGVTAPRGRFRADQLFEPNADGADMIIPEMALAINASAAIPDGVYPISVYGAAAGDSAAKRVEAHATMMQGPLLDLWNFIRRPVPAITMTVVQPFAPQLSTGVRTLRLERGKPATIELTAENIPESASFRLLDLPDGVQYKMLGRQGSQVTVSLEASPEAAAGTYDISAETEVGSRKAPSPSIALVIQVPAKH